MSNTFPPSVPSQPAPPAEQSSPPAPFGQPTPPPPAPGNPFNIAPGKNGLGLASVILGGVAFLFAFIPGVNFFAGFLALVGLVLGVVALAQKNKVKTAALIGTILNAVAGILSIIMIVVYAAAFVAAVDESTNSDGKVITTEDTAEEPAAEVDAPAADLGTRENPAPIGSTVAINSLGSPAYEVTATAPTWDVNAQVEDANMLNPDPKAGNQYASLPVSVKYVGDDSGHPQFDLQFSFVSAEGQAYDGGFVVMDGQLSDVDELFPDATGTGTIIIELPTAAVGTGTWSVGNVFGDPVFFAAQ